MPRITSHRLIVFLLMLSFCAVAVAADTSKVADQVKPKTKFETFASADGKLLVKEFHDLPAPKSQYGKTEAQLIKVTSVGTNDSQIGLKISHTSTERYARTRSSMLDEDEVVSLAQALDYLAKNQQRITEGAETYTEITYTSRSGFRAGLFITPSEGKTGCYMVVGSESVFMNSLDELTQTVRGAQEKIRQIK